MKKFDFISWILAAPVIPLLSAIFKSKGEPTPATNLIVGLYGYFVVCSVLFNIAVVFAFLSEVFK